MPTGSEWSGTPSIKGNSESTRMILLTFSLIGLQLTWGLEQTYCTPYLLSLGLTKSKTSLVWIAGPLSGLFIQPIVGTIADRSTSRFGRRRPFMIGGSAVMSVCLFLLGWTSEIVGVFLSEGTTKKNMTIFVAVIAIYALDFAINAVQACCRSIIVDVLPISQQQTGSAWASRMAASGHVIGFLIGTFDLVKIFPNWIGGDTQFKKMCLVAILGLWLAVGITSYTVTERILLRSPDHGKPILSTMTILWQRIWNLPARIQLICWCQFWAWIGWFPFLFYSSTWVGETYYRYDHPEPEPGAEDNHDALGNIGRLGSLSLVLFSIITFAAAVALPYLVRKPEEPSPRDNRGRFTPRPPASLGKNVQKIVMLVYGLPKPDLVTTWAISHLCFAFIMFFAPFVRSLAFATTLVALCGIPWAVSCWAPFAEIGVEINKMASGGLDQNGSVTGVTLTSGGYTAVRPSLEDEDDVEMDLPRGHNRVSSTASTGVLHLTHPDDDDQNSTSSTGELAGVYLGILNVYTVLPQFVSTFVSWIVFSLLEPNRNESGNEDSNDSSDHKKYLDLKGVNAIAVCLFVGSMCAIVAAEATRRLKKME